MNIRVYTLYTYLYVLECLVHVCTCTTLKAHQHPNWCSELLPSELGTHKTVKAFA